MPLAVRHSAYSTATDPCTSSALSSAARSRVRRRRSRSSCRLSVSEAAAAAQRGAGARTDREPPATASVAARVAASSIRKEERTTRASSSRASALSCSRTNDQIFFLQRQGVARTREITQPPYLNRQSAKRGRGTPVSFGAAAAPSTMFGKPLLGSSAPRECVFNAVPERQRAETVSQ